MYIIAVYDVGEKRVQLKELKYRAKEIMKDDEDSFIIFSSREQKWMDKQVLGKEKNSLDNFL